MIKLARKLPLDDQPCSIDPGDLGVVPATGEAVQHPAELVEVDAEVVQDAPRVGRQLHEPAAQVVDGEVISTARRRARRRRP